LSRFRVKIEDYIAFGVENIWIIDPATRSAMTADRFGIHPVESGELTVPETPIRVDLKELFAELDRA
jgi:Uma2 family endonuclease